MENNDQEKDKFARQYDLFASKFNELYLAGKERSREAMEIAMEKTQEQMTALGEFSAEQGEMLKKYLARDLDQVIASTQKMGEEAKEMFHPARLGAGAMASLATVLELTSNAFRSLSEKTKESLTYKTGEVTSAGTLTCQACQETVQLKATGEVPACPKCNGTLFSKGY